MLPALDSLFSSSSQGMFNNGVHMKSHLYLMP